ncbi:hypothetical protein J2T17_003159 [Paenibacillus mucilaginosus]|uniref:hypothetical protein n=1 Tax=Paenibacillus mucilaginosus TaxID=61624 RepID=UPI003D220497
MQNYIDILNIKRKSLAYHYEQIEACLRDFSSDHLHVLIGESSALMETINSCIEISRICAYKQSPVDVMAYMESQDESLRTELKYIQQWVETNRKDNVFLFPDQGEIYIKPLRVKNKLEYTDQREWIPYLREVRELAEKIMQDFMDIYTNSTVHYDQSWRTIDIHRSSFTCRECGAFVTGILSHIGNLNSIALKDRESYLPRLSYVYGTEIVKAGLLPWRGVGEITNDDILVSTDGLYMDLKKEPATGCCGPDGSTFNVFCRNGHPVGKEAADCWMPHFIRFPLDRVNRYENID